MLANIGDLLMRSRVIVPRVVTGAALVLAFGQPMADSNVAWAQCNETAKLLPSDGALGDAAGRSVAISGDVAVVGVPNDDDNGTDSGSAYVFRFNPATSGWVQEQKLLASDGLPFASFGRSVTIDGDAALIGAPGHSDNVPESGAAYLFRFNGVSWVEEQKLLASDGVAWDSFGDSVALSNDVAIVGAHRHGGTGPSSNSGAAYVFRFDGSVWAQEDKLLPSGDTWGDGFGQSAAVSGNWVVVGVPFDDDNGGNSGSAYVFHFSGGSWVQEAKLLASDGAAIDMFGLSVAISDDVAIVGAPRDDDDGTSSGSAYLFRRTAGTWVEEQKLLASDGAAGDQFGFSVAISAGLAVSGAWGDDDNGTDSGSAYLFRFDGSTWIGEPKYLASEYATLAPDYFGYSVALSGDRAVVGASWDDDNGYSSGSAYVFGGACTTDLDGDGAVGVADLIILLSSWGACSGCPADVVVDDVVNVQDLVRLLAEWGSCP